MNVLDLFAGKGGWSQAFRDRGHDVTRVELEPRYQPDICADILTLTAESFQRFEPFDLILASPPCEKFSIAGHGAPWQPLETGFIPRTTEAIDALRLAMHAQYLIHALAPKAAIMENPSGLMKKILPMKPQVLVWYCQYGDTRAKPTDLWLFGAAQGFFFKPPCRNKRGDDRDFCHHEAAPRGAKTGTQGAGSYHDRSLVPYGLSQAVCEQMEQHLAGTLPSGRLAV